MVETIYHSTESMITINILTNRIHTIIPKKETTPKERDTYGLIVDGKDKTFKDVLCNINLVKSNSARKAFRSLKSTRHGKLIIITDKNDTAFEEITKLVKDNGDFNTKIAGLGQNKETLFLRGMDNKKKT